MDRIAALAGLRGDSGYLVLHWTHKSKAEKDTLRDRYLFLEAQAQAK